MMSLGIYLTFTLTITYNVSNIHHLRILTLVVTKNTPIFQETEVTANNI